MENIKFEWDESKNQINKKKHHISFEEAKTVFEDVEALIIDALTIHRRKTGLSF